jgi:hypothetical protein
MGKIKSLSNLLRLFIFSSASFTRNANPNLLYPSERKLRAKTAFLYRWFVEPYFQKSF